LINIFYAGSLDKIKGTVASKTLSILGIKSFAEGTGYMTNSIVSKKCSECAFDANSSFPCFAVGISDSLCTLGAYSRRKTKSRIAARART